MSPTPEHCKHIYAILDHIDGNKEWTTIVLKSRGLFPFDVYHYYDWFLVEVLNSRVLRREVKNIFDRYLSVLPERFHNKFYLKAIELVTARGDTAFVKYFMKKVSVNVLDVLVPLAIQSRNNRLVKFLLKKCVVTEFDQLLLTTLASIYNVPTLLYLVTIRKFMVYKNCLFVHIKITNRIDATIPHRVIDTGDGIVYIP